MGKPFSLQTLLDLALIGKESATRRLGELNKEEHDTQAQLDMLLEYRRDYQAQLQASSQTGLNPPMLRNFQEFIRKLDTAIAEQRINVQRSQLSTQTGRNEYSKMLRKLQSFDTLQQRHFEQEKKIEAKQEQKAMDEHTGRAAAYKMLIKEPGENT